MPPKVTSTALSDREKQILALAWHAMETEPKINIKKLASLAGMTNPASASNAWRQIKNKLSAQAETDIAAANGSSGSNGAASDGEVGSKSASPVKPAGGGNKRPRKPAAAAAAAKASGGDGEDGEDGAEAPKAKRGRKAKENAKVKMEEVSEEEDAVGEVVEEEF